MFARHVTMQLKPTIANKFPAAIGREILPLLRKQRGFLDEFLLMTPEKREVVAIGLWETEEHPENYHRDVYPQIEEILNRFAEGIPVVMKFEPQYSTFHTIAFAAMA